MQHQVMQQHPQRQILVQHQQQYPHHPQQHQMVQHQQQQYIMVQQHQQPQQQGVQHLRLQQHMPPHDPNNPIRRAIPIRFHRPAGPQQYPPQQHQYLPQPQQMVQQQPGMPGQQQPAQQKIYVIQGGNGLRLNKPNGIQAVAFRGPMMVAGAQTRPMMSPQQQQQQGQLRPLVRPQIRHPVVHQAGKVNLLYTISYYTVGIQIPETQMTESLE